MMNMNRTTLALLSTLAGLLLLIGGIVVGNLLRDDDQPDVAAAPDAVDIAAATPAQPDSGPDGPSEPFWSDPSPRKLPLDQVSVGVPSTPSSTSGGDPDGPAVAPTAGPSPGLTEDGPISLAEREPDEVTERVYDADSGIDSDAEGDIYIPPTMPAVDDITEDTTGPTGSTLVEAPEDTTGPTGSTIVGDDAEVDLDDLFYDFDLGRPGPHFEYLPFRDACADRDEESGGDDDPCPEGVGGTITLLGGGDPPEPLAISAQFYTSVTSSLELRCPNLGVGDDGVYRPLFSSNNPADFTITYWATTGDREDETITLSTSDAETDWWLDRRAAGDEVWANPHGGVHNCPEFPDLHPGRRMAFEIHGVDRLGTEDTVRIFMEAPSGTGGGNRPIKFTPRNRLDHPDHGLLSVPYDDTTESVYMASIPKNGARGSHLSCSDIEGAILDGVHRNDPSLVDVSHGVLARAPDSELDPALNRVLIGTVYPEEGTTYELCAWVAQPAERSFDRPNVIVRESFTVRAPRRLRARIFIGGGHVDRPLEPLDLRVEAANWDSGRGSSFPREAMDAGAFMLDRPVLMTSSGSMEIPGSTLLEVTGPTGNTIITEVPTRTRCPIFFPIGCPRPGTSQYDIQIPGRVANRGLCGSSFGSCDPPSEQTFIGNLRIIVERYAGPGGVPTGNPIEDGWQVRPEGSFAPADPAERPASPQIDGHSSYLRARPAEDGGRPGMIMHLEFDRPVRVEATPFMNLIEDCGTAGPQFQAEYQSSVTMIWEDLCYEGAYSISLLVEDEELNTLDRRTHVDGEATGDVGWGYVVLPGVPITEFSLDVTVHRLGDGIAPQVLDLSVGEVSVGAFIAPGRPPRCASDFIPNSFERTVRSDGGRPIVWGDPVHVFVTVSGTGDGRDCGLESPFVRVNTHASVLLDDLLAGPVTLDLGDADAEITIEISDVVGR